jgi:hypothetical protein
MPDTELTDDDLLRLRTLEDAASRSPWRSMVRGSRSSIRRYVHHGRIRQRSRGRPLPASRQRSCERGRPRFCRGCPQFHASNAQRNCSPSKHDEARIGSERSTRQRPSPRLRSQGCMGWSPRAFQRHLGLNPRLSAVCLEACDVRALHRDGGPSASSAVPAPGTLKRVAAIWTVALNWRGPLYDLVTPGALEECDLQPLTRPHRMGQRDLGRHHPTRIQYTAGSGPPEPDTSR